MNIMIHKPRYKGSSFECCELQSSALETPDAMAVLNLSVNLSSPRMMPVIEFVQCYIERI